MQAATHRAAAHQAAVLQPDPAGRITWRTRRAALVDVPAVARLTVPPLPAGVASGLLLRSAELRALRLLLAHVGLDRGEVWVAADAAKDGGDDVLGAVALLPPPCGPGERALLLALRLDLGLGADRRLLDDCARDALVRPDHWVLLPVGGPAVMARQLLRAALPALDAAGLAAVALPGTAPELLAEAGFTVDLVRPASRTVRAPVAAVRAGELLSA